MKKFLAFLAVILLIGAVFTPRDEQKAEEE